jgi:hypothetical protein
MYGTNGPVGAATVVGDEVVVCVVVVAPEVAGGTEVVVVAPEVVGGAGTVVVAPELVESVVVVPLVVVPVVVVPVVVPPLEVVSVEAPLDVGLGVVSENVLPIVIGDTSPNAPETSRPSANTAASATVVRMWRLRPPRLTRQPPGYACSPGPQPDDPRTANPISLAPQLPQ